MVDFLSKHPAVKMLRRLLEQFAAKSGAEGEHAKDEWSELMQRLFRETDELTVQEALQKGLISPNAQSVLDFEKARPGGWELLRGLGLKTPRQSYERMQKFLKIAKHLPNTLTSAEKKEADLLDATFNKSFTMAYMLSKNIGIAYKTGEMHDDSSAMFALEYTYTHNLRRRPATFMAYIQGLLQMAKNDRKTAVGAADLIDYAEKSFNRR